MSSAFFDEIGGKSCIERVHKILYDKLLAHPWLKEFFVGLERSVLEDQQTDFMADLFGRAPKLYAGRLPMRAHQHLFITEEIFMIRHKLLAESISQANVAENLKERWLGYDVGMKAAIVKKSVDECEGRYKTEKVLVVPKPA
jgi:hemoglobin